MRFERVGKKKSEDLGDLWAIHDIDADFQEFHRKNPEVYDQLVKLATSAQERGARFGIKCLWEVMRWHFWIETDTRDFKLNNSYTSRYARLIMQQEPQLEGFFNTRVLRS